MQKLPLHTFKNENDTRLHKILCHIIRHCAYLLHTYSWAGPAEPYNGRPYCGLISGL